MLVLELTLHMSAVLADVNINPALGGILFMIRMCSLTQGLH